MRARAALSPDRLAWLVVAVPAQRPADVLQRRIRLRLALEKVGRHLRLYLVPPQHVLLERRLLSPWAVVRERPVLRPDRMQPPEDLHPDPDLLKVHLERDLLCRRDVQRLGRSEDPVLPEDPGGDQWPMHLPERHDDERLDVCVGLSLGPEMGRVDVLLARLDREERQMRLQLGSAGVQHRQWQMRERLPGHPDVLPGFKDVLPVRRDVQERRVRLRTAGRLERPRQGYGLQAQVRRQPGQGRRPMLPRFGHSSRRRQMRLRVSSGSSSIGLFARVQAKVRQRIYVLHDQVLPIRCDAGWP